MDHRKSFGAVCVFGALILLVVPIKWILAATVSVAVHEMCHILAVCAFGGRLVGCNISQRGLRIEATDLSVWQRLVCILAGPLGAGVLCAFYRFAPRIAICAFVQTAYNLLPVEPLDGGRILRCLCLLLFSPEAADRICRLSGRVCFVLLAFVICIVFFVLRLGILGILPFIMALIRVISEKDLAKERFRRYNRWEHPTKEQSYEGTAATDPARRPKAGTVYRRRI